MKIFVWGDSHNCSDENLELANSEAQRRGCKILVHTGDMIDEHLNHPCFRDKEMYVFLTNINKNLPAKLDNNWHLLDEKNCIVELIAKNNKKIRLYVNHYLGLDSLRTKTRDFLRDLSRSEIWQIAGKIQSQYSFHLDYILCGHSHHEFFSSFHGTGMVNPGEWQNKLTFSVISTGTWDIVMGSLTQNFQKTILS